MNKTFTLTELGVVISANSNNPSVLNPDFLKYNGIVPQDWELAAPPLCAGPVAQVQFKNGITVLAQPEKLIFSEAIAPTVSPRIPEIAAKYVKTLPHVGYTALGVNPRGHVVADSEQVATEFVLTKIVAPGPWAEFQGHRPKVMLRFSYTLAGGGLLNLALEDSKYENAGNVQFVILFAANFHRNLATSATIERVEEICGYLAAWQHDLDVFRGIVNEKFVGASVQL